MNRSVFPSIATPVDALKSLDTARKHLRVGNLFSAIVSFKETLDGFLHLKELAAADRTRLSNALNDFQQKLSASPEFHRLYGRVPFRDDDFSTSVDFLGQLLSAKEDEISNMIEKGQSIGMMGLDNLNEEDQQKAVAMVAYVEQGELAALRKLVEENDQLAALVMDFYNDGGIELRKSGDIDQAVHEYKKALSISPDDEHLYYNLARAYIEDGQRKNARKAIEEALKLNPDFSEGAALAQYIEGWKKS
ncbi:MAG TPA: tetratricopeptide repeat protein [Smithellaceae bacterium]|nr:tetratricopeptide repeat protein [Smithellaceae bacterium]